MDHYLELTVLPDPEFSESVLMNALFAKLHRALGQTAQGAVGISFPAYNKTLGSTVRLHGEAPTLDRFMSTNWLQGMRDYCRCSEIAAVPEGAKHRVVKRVQAKSAHNKRKRSVAKGWLTEEEALQKIPESQQKPLKLPFLQLKSLSNGNTMRIYVEHGNLQDEPTEGSFSSYGLSATSSVPWF